MTSIKSLVLICDTHFFQRLHGVVNYVDLPECSSQETLCRGIEQHGIVERDHNALRRSAIFRVTVLDL